MGSVLLVYEIRPESVEVTPEIVEGKIRTGLDPKFQMQDNPEEKPLFFGMVGIIGQFIIPEEDGAQDQLEKFLNSLEEISSIQMTFVTRL
jgi:translation elongation factor EF-1beta